MSYKVKIKHTAVSGNGISVEALVEGEAVAHTFPKNSGYFEQPARGRPRFVKKLEEKYEEKLKREGRVSVQEISPEESKIKSNYFHNQEYGSETFKQDNKQEPDMEVDINDPEEVRQYLKENMAEGYLSEDEGLHIDEFVDEYQRLLEMEESLDDVVKEAVGVE